MAKMIPPTRHNEENSMVLLRIATFGPIVSTTPVYHHSNSIEKGETNPVAAGMAAGLENPDWRDVNNAMVADRTNS